TRCSADSSRVRGPAASCRTVTETTSRCCRRQHCQAIVSRPPTNPDRPRPPGDVRLSVVVPAYQEHDRIDASVRTIRGALGELDGGLEIVVVDDGSTDGTSAAARAAGADQVLV